jgi:hypothetical protein
MTDGRKGTGRSEVGIQMDHEGKNSVLLKTFFDYGGKKKKGAKRP